MLFLVSTPIGNLGDFSARAVETLKRASMILCEDTRRTRILLDRYAIDRPLASYHKFNEIKELEKVLVRLREGEEIALVSDAGTPLINDPGGSLVQACIREGILFTLIPGPCSPVMALVLSGFDATRFQFIGYLPKKPEEALRQAIAYPGATIALESPERLASTLKALEAIDPKRKTAVAREMTKAFEECRRGTAQELREHYERARAKGEVCLVIEGGAEPDRSMPLDELIQTLQELHGLSLKEAIKLAAKIQKRPKSEVYKEVHVR